MIAILGKTGTGKTCLMRRLLNQHSRVFLFDPTHDPAFNDWAPVTRTFKDAIGPAHQKTFRIRLCQIEPFTLEDVCRASFAHLKNCLIAVDELQAFVPSGHKEISKWFRFCVLQGRHEGISLIGTSQRPANVHNDFLSQSDLTYLFRSEVEDLGWLRKYKALHGAPFLKVGQFLTWPERSERSGVRVA